MIITHLNYSDISGGAARAAYRLHTGLKLLGEDSYMLVIDKKSTDKKIFNLTLGEFAAESEEKIKEKFFTDIIQNKYIDKNRTEISNTLFTLPYPGYNINTVPSVQKSDIINFHWVSFYLSLSSLKNIFALKKKIVWTLHDQEPFTGGCHYASNCEKYIYEDCLNCPQIKDDYFHIPNDVFKDKIEVFKESDVTIVTPSKWLARCAQKSKLFKNFRIEVIPNSVETDIFYPIDKKIAKKRLDIPEDSLTILFGAENGNEKRKGFHLLLKAIRHCLSNPIFKKMTEEKKLNILCFGDPSSDLNSLNIDIKSMGYIKSDSTLSTVYSASDFVVLPSIEDNLPNIILEAFGCKTPVIAFNTGGMPDMIIHNVTGKLVKAFDEIDLGEKIIETILRPEELPVMGNECRKIIERKFNLEEQARNYSNLYKDLLSKKELDYSSKYYDFSNPAEYKVNMNLGMLNNFRNNDIFKNSFDIYKNLYYLILSNQRILNSYSYKLSVSFFHPGKLFAKILRFLSKKVKIIPKENKMDEKKIKVLFDYQIFNLQSHGGISRYFTEIFSCFKKMNIIDYSLPILYTKNSYLSEKSVIIDGKKKSLFKKDGLDNFFPGINFKGKRRIYALLKKMGLIKSETYFKNKNKKISVKRLKKRDFDLFHPTYYSKYFLEYLGDSPFVLTIHDMIHEIFSDRFPLLRDETAAIKRELALKASKIIAVSENTKKDIIKFYGISEDKIKVIYHATSLKLPKENSDLCYNLPEKYILFVGDRNNYKNFCFFVHSISSLLRNGKDLFLIAAGGGDFSQEENFFIKANFIENKVRHISFDDDLLAALYNKALCFAFPSLYEGFGIPILEAFSCGCPIAISNKSCFPEIAKDAAVYFDPYDEKSVRETVETLIYDENLRNSLKNKGYERLKDFDWQKTAVETATLYEEVAKSY